MYTCKHTDAKSLSLLEMSNSLILFLLKKCSNKSPNIWLKQLLVSKCVFDVSDLCTPCF